MGFRITTNMMMNSYRYNLQNNTKKLSDSRDMVLTHRNFNSYAEDPASATRAFRLRRSYTRTINQLNNAKDCYGKFNTAWNNLGEIITNLENPLAKVSSIRGPNGTSGESQHALAQVLRETADSIVHSMNAKLGEQFVFAGVDGMNVPFTWSEDGTQLYFRGVNVNAGKVEMPTAKEPTWLADAKAANGGTLSEADQAWYDYYTHVTDVKPENATKPQWAKDLEGKTPTDPVEQKWLAYYKHEGDIPIAEEPKWAKKVTDADGNEVFDPKYFDSYGTPKVDEITQDFAPLSDKDRGWIAYYSDQADLVKLKKMSSEERYIDLGMGAKENEPNDPILGSYFNDALVGINFLGYGVDKSDGFGDAGNYAVMLKELADVFDTWDEDADPQGYNPDLAKNSAAGMTSKELEAKAFRMIDKLKAGQEKFTESYVEMDARSKFLQTTEDRLSTQKTNINEQILDIEQVDLAEAITSFSWDMYCYNAALKIGNQLLSQSLIDYMN